MKALNILFASAAAASVLAVAGCSSTRSEPQPEVATAPVTVPETPAEPVADASTMPTHPAMPAEAAPEVAAAPEPAPMQTAKEPEPMTQAPVDDSIERAPRADRN